MSYEETRVASLEFDNAQFKREVSETIKSLQKLEKAMQFEDINSDEVFDELIQGSRAAERQMDSMASSVDNIKMSFSALQVVGLTVLSELTKSALTAGKQIYNATLGQIKAGGSSRALNIEAAKFQLEGLGVAWSDIQEDINYGVQDTAYGLDAAAKVASQLVASQVSLGADMRTALRGISGVAAMTNSSYEEIGHIFTTVAGNGRVMGEQLRSLSIKGLNTAAVLAKYLGKTEQEVRDMVTAGKISFQDFANAMDSAFGEHAKDANKTFAGAMSNIKSALSRVGAKFMAPFYDFARDIMNTFRPIINYMNKALDPAVETYEWLLNSVGTYLQSLMHTKSFQEGMVSVVIDLWSWIRTLIQAFMEMGWVAPDVRTVADAFKEFMISLQLWGDKAETARKIFVSILSILDIGFTVIKGIWNIAQPVFELLLQTVGSIFGITGDTYEIISRLREPIKIIIMYISDLIKSGLLNYIRGIGIILKAIFGAIKFVIPVASKIVLILVQIGYVIVSLIKQGFELVYNTVSGCASIEDAIRRIIDLLLNGVTVAKNFLAQLFSGVNLRASVGVEVDDSQATTANASLNSIASASEQVTTAVNQTTDAVDSLTDSVADSGDEIGKFADGVNSLKEASDNTKAAVDQMAQGIIKADNDLSRIRNLKGASIPEPSDNRTSSAPPLPAWSPDSEATGLGGNLSNAITPDLETTKKTFGEKISDFVESFKQKFSEGLQKISDFIPQSVKEHFTNPWNWVVDAFVGSGVLALVSIGSIIFKVFNALINNLNVLPKTAEALLQFAKSFAYKELTNVFKQLTFVMLSLAAFIGVVAIVSKTCDPEAIDMIMRMIMKLAGMIMGLATLIALFNVVGKLADTISTAIYFVKNKTLPLSNATLISNYMKSLAILIAAISGIILIAKLCKPEEIAKGFLIVIMTLKITSKCLVHLDKTLKGDYQNTIKGNWDRKAKTITRETISATAGIRDIILSMAVMISTVVFATKILANVQWQDLLKTGIFIGSMIGIVTVFLGIISKATSSGIRSNAALASGADAISRTLGVSARGSEANGGALAAIGSIIRTLSTFMIAMAISAKLMSTIDPWALEAIGKTMALMLRVVGATVFLLSASMNSYLKETEKVSLIKESPVQNAAKMTSLAIMLGSIAGSLLILTVALKIMDSIDIFYLKDELLAMGVMLLGLVVAILVLNIALNDFGMSFKGLDIIHSASNAGNLVALSQVLIGMTVAILALSIATGLMSTIPSYKLWDSVLATVALITALTVGVILIVTGINALIKMLQTNPLNGNSKLLNKTIAVIFVATGAIVALIGAITVMSVALKDIDSTTLLTNLAPLGLALLAIGVLIAEICIFAKNPAAISAMGFASILIGSVIGVVLAVTLMGKVLDSCDPESISATVKLLTITFIGIGGMLLIIGLLAPELDLAMPVILALGGFMISLGLMATLFAASAYIFSEALKKVVDAFTKLFEKFPIMDAFNEKVQAFANAIEVVGASIVKVMAQVAPIAGFLAGAAAILVLAAAPLVTSFALLAIGISYCITTLSNINPESLSDVSEVLVAFFNEIAEAVAVISSATNVTDFIFEFAIKFGIASFALLGASIQMAISVWLLTSVKDMMFSTFSEMVDFFIDFGARFAESQDMLLYAIDQLATFGGALTWAGVALTFGGALLTTGSVLLLLGSVALDQAISLLYLTFTTYDMNFIISSMDQLVPLAGALALSGITLLAGATLFGLGSGIFLMASGSFASAMGLMRLAIGDGAFIPLLLENIKMLVPISLSMMVAGLMMITSSISFMAGCITMSVAGSLFIGTILIFKQGVELFEDVVDDLCDIAEEIVDTFVYIVDSIRDVLGIHSPSAVMEEIGGFFLQGFINGITSKIGEVIDTVSEVAGRVLTTFRTILGIHSPSTEGESDGGNWITGIVNGIKSHIPSLDNVVSGITNYIRESFNIDLSGQGGNIGSTLVSGLGNVLSNSGIGEALSGIGSNWGDALGGSMLSTFSGYTRQMLQDQINLLSSQIAERNARLDGNTENFTATRLHAYQRVTDELANERRALQKQLDAMGPESLGYSGFIDPGSFLGSGSSSISNIDSFSPATSEALANLGGSGTGGTASMASGVGDNVGNTITTNNTYNFTQNNYSPEPIDRTELYTQTNNQLNSWYKWLQTQ